jgi:hypothetical protein
MDKAWKREPSEYQKKILDKYNLLSDNEKKMAHAESIQELKPILRSTVRAYSPVKTKSILKNSEPVMRQPVRREPLVRRPSPERYSDPYSKVIHLSPKSIHSRSPKKSPERSIERRSEGRSQSRRA